MSNNIGRNAPCSCGSGKKYKKCCLLKSLAKKSKCDLSHEAFRNIEKDVFEKHLWPYLEKLLVHYDDILDCAYGDFLLDDLLNSPPLKAHRELFRLNVFLPWMVFHWIPSQHFENIFQFDVSEPIAANYLREHADRLNAREKNFFLKMLFTYFSFYRVEEVIITESVVVKDLLLGTMHKVLAYETTKVFKPGSIVFGRLLQMEGGCFFVSLTPFVFPPDMQETILALKTELIDCNDGLPLNVDLLYEKFEFDVIESFLAMMQQFFDTKNILPKNADGQILIETTIYGDLDLPIEKALSRLMSLTFSNDPKKILRRAKRDLSGDIIEIDVPWFDEDKKKYRNKKNADSVLGHITLKKGELILDVNSRERSEKGIMLLEKLLGASICFDGNIKKELLLPIDDFG